MKILKNSIFFLCALVLHVELLFVFSSTLYLLYFINLFIAMYILHKVYIGFSSIIFLLYSSLFIVLINLHVYEEYIFEFYLFIDVITQVPFINSEVMYALIAVHLLLLFNLKKFDSFWVIIDKKLFRI